LFVRPNEIVRFCEKNGLKICMDLSHSALACNYFGIPLPEFVASVGHLVDHMHISDAKGVDGEGLPIGSGDLDFYELAGAISKSVPANASWIPEVWQGHKNKGEGFLDALEKLSAYPNGF
jgi:N-acetylneuraminate synthase